MRQRRIVVRYLGGGWLPGVPQRDLTVSDLRSLAPEARALLREHLRLAEGRVYEGESPEEGDDASSDS